jgi:hypothetical protein
LEIYRERLGKVRKKREHCNGVDEDYGLWGEGDDGDEMRMTCAISCSYDFQIESSVESIPRLTATNLALLDPNPDSTQD